MADQRTSRGEVQPRAHVMRSEASGVEAPLRRKFFRRVVCAFCLCPVALAQSVTSHRDAAPQRGRAESVDVTAGSPVSKVWRADNGDGTYKNPVLYADYSDPDVVRVGDDFYLTSSSFSDMPGLPIMHSKDLVNWTIVGHALREQPPADVYRSPQHGNGVWAPSLRYHAGKFFLFYGDPDFGIYMLTASNAAGPWSEPHLVKAVKGWIDPCPLWDDDGNAYLVHGMAASRSGIKSILVVHRMSPDGTRLLDDGAIVFDGHDRNPTVEGPKFYKRNGSYWIFAPAGGVEGGWQLAMRARTPFGPYESKVVLAQGWSPINGPHQGAWVETPNGDSWFLHFQDQGAYGRVVHLQPMQWRDGWPIVGNNGEPVLAHAKPTVGNSSPAATPPDSDEFNGSAIGLQWQWPANPQPNWAFASPLGFLRLFNVPPPDGARNLWDVPNLLLEKFPAPVFTATTKLTFTSRADGEKAGLVIMGLDYAYAAVMNRAGKLVITQAVCKNADRQAAETAVREIPVDRNTIYLRVAVRQGAIAQFSYSSDGETFNPLGEPFTARPGRWIGAKMGLFAVGAGEPRETGYADFDWFRVE